MAHAEFDSEVEEDGSEGCNSPSIIRVFERKSVELLGYVSGLEAQLEQHRAQSEHAEKRLKAEKKEVEQELALREAELRAEVRALEDKLRFAVEQAGRAEDAFLEEERKRIGCDEAVRSLERELEARQESLQVERRRAQELEDRISELKEQMELREQVFRHWRSKDLKAKAKLEEEARVLRKKVTLGWILGCLSEIYMRLSPENDGGNGDLRNSSALFRQINDPAKLARMQKELERFIDTSEIPDANSIKIKNDESSTEGSILEEKIDWEHSKLDGLERYKKKTLRSKNCHFPRSLTPSPKPMHTLPRMPESASGRCTKRGTGSHRLGDQHISHNEEAMLSRCESSLRNPKNPHSLHDLDSGLSHDLSTTVAASSLHHPGSETPKLHAKFGQKPPETEAPATESFEELLFDPSSQQWSSAIDDESSAAPVTARKEKCKHGHSSDGEREIDNCLIDKENSRTVRDSFIRNFFSGNERKHNI